MMPAPITARCWPRGIAYSWSAPTSASAPRRSCRVSARGMPRSVFSGTKNWSATRPCLIWPPSTPIWLAKAYDYETGLLHTDKGRQFVKRIVNSRALGVVKDGQPQYAASNTGDPGLSSVLAEMQADWDVLKGRLGFNNPDTYGTTVSMRGEKYRILPGADGLDTGVMCWKCPPKRISAIGS